MTDWRWLKNLAHHGARWISTPTASGPSPPCEPGRSRELREVMSRRTFTVRMSSGKSDPYETDCLEVRSLSRSGASFPVSVHRQEEGKLHPPGVLCEQLHAGEDETMQDQAGRPGQKGLTAAGLAKYKYSYATITISNTHSAFSEAPDGASL